MGRRLGKPERKSERKAQSSRANARRPRGRRPNEAEKSIIDEAKEVFRSNMAAGAREIVKIALRKVKNVTKMDQIAAFKTMAAKGDMPDVTQTDVSINGMPAVNFNFKNLPNPAGETGEAK